MSEIESAQQKARRELFERALKRKSAEIEAALEGGFEGDSLDVGLEAVEGADAGELGGLRLSHFELRECLGQGGMGVVYRGVQREPVEREVAVKVMRRVLPGGTGFRRFEAEQRALGRLSHPNVAALHEVGTTEEGRPFLVMELVEGVPITEYCERRGLGTRERLQLFVGVCSGVAHAHEKGILHRDLKPANILVLEVDGRAVPKVIDFGIAKGKALGEGSVTGEGLVGTASYLAPEVIAGGVEVDVRVDVYALGVVLCELLVGRRPFESDGDVAAFWRQVVEEDPPGLSALAPSKRELKGNLEAIAAQALARDRQERYESVEALRRDVQRHLSGELVRAREKERWFAVRRWARRHRVAAAMAGLGLGGGVLGAAGLGWGIREARESAVLARASAERARRASVEAEEVAEFLTELFAAADPWEVEGEVTGGDLLEEGVRRARELPEEERRLLLETFARIYEDAGREEEARRTRGVS